MRQLRRWKRLWRRSLTCSHKRTSMGPSRSGWNGTTSALQLEEITLKGTRVLCVLSIKVPIRKKSGNLFNDPHIYIYIYIYSINRISFCYVYCDKYHEQCIMICILFWPEPDSIIIYIYIYIYIYTHTLTHIHIPHLSLPIKKFSSKSLK